MINRDLYVKFMPDNMLLSSYNFAWVFEKEVLDLYRTNLRFQFSPENDNGSPQKFVQG